MFGLSKGPSQQQGFLGSSRLWLKTDVRFIEKAGDQDTQDSKEQHEHKGEVVQITGCGTDRTLGIDTQLTIEEPNWSHRLGHRTQHEVSFVDGASPGVKAHAHNKQTWTLKVPRKLGTSSVGTR